MNLADAYRARSGGRGRRSAVQDNDYFPLQGGLNQEDSPLNIRPGECLASKNYEPGIRGGYRRVDGFERYDGQLAPSAAAYLQVYWDGGRTPSGYSDGFDEGFGGPEGGFPPDNYPAVGDTVTSASGGSGTIAAIYPGGVSFSSGYSAGFGGTPYAGFLILVGVTGTFANDDTLTSNAEDWGAVDGVPTAEAIEDVDDEAYSQLAADYQRAFLDPVPGVGPVRGVQLYAGVVYAFRDNAGATACVMHRSTSSGWEAVPLQHKIRFDAGGTGEFSAGDTVVGASSGASATVLRVGTNGGTWAGGDKTGFLILGPITGGPFTDGENLQVSAATIAVADGGSFQQSMQPGGTYEFRVNNFYGHADRRRMYGVNRIDPVFEYDSADGVFSQIDTGMPLDTPLFLAAHLDRLALMFPGGSMQLSGQHRPDDWEVVLGALELTLGGACTGMLEEIGQAGNQALFAFTRDETFVLTGVSTASFQLIRFARDTGAVARTIQRIGQGVFLDDRGFSTLAAVQEFGNFNSATFSQKIQRLVNSLRGRAVDSHVRRDRNLYRCSFSDGTQLVVGFSDNKVTGLMQTNYDRVVTCSTSEEDNDGQERTFFGAADGYVYEIAEGLRDFDGDPVESFIRLAFHHSGRPTRHKRYRLAQVDLRTESRLTQIKGQVDYSNADPDFNFQPQRDLDVPGGGGFWDVDDWGTFQWDSGITQVASFKLEGSGINIGLGFYQKTRRELPHTLYGITLQFSPRRLNRSTNVS